MCHDTLKKVNIGQPRYQQFKQDYLDWKQKKPAKMITKTNIPTEKPKLEDSKSSNYIFGIVKDVLIFLFILVAFFSKEVKSFNASQRKLLFLVLIILFVLSNFAMQTNPVELMLSVIKDSIIAGLALFVCRKYLPQVFKILGVNKSNKGAIAFLAIELAVVFNMVWYSCKNIFLFLSG